MNPSSFALALLVLSFPMFAGITAAQTANDQKHRMAVTGHGEASGKPDIATITVGVVAQAANADDAVQQNSEIATRLFERLRAAGIEERDMQTSSFDVQPQYAQEQPDFPRQADGNVLPEITGYRVSNQVRIRVRQLDRVGTLLDELVQAGSNQIYGIQFSVADPKPLADKAKRSAVEDAFRVAKLYADAAGVELGGMLTLSEQIDQPQQPMGYARAMMAESSVPIAAGEYTVEATVHVEFEFKPRQ